MNKKASKRKHSEEAANQTQNTPQPPAKRARVDPSTAQIGRPFVVCRVPAELWQKISSYLPLSSRGALALTCRDLCDEQILGELRTRRRYGNPKNPALFAEQKKFQNLLKVGRLPASIWSRVTKDLSYVDKVSLLVSCSYFYNRLGRNENPQILERLKLPSMADTRMMALFKMPKLFNDMTLCSECVAYYDTETFMPEGHLNNFQEFDDRELQIVPGLVYSWDELYALIGRREGRYLDSDMSEPDDDGWKHEFKFHIDDDVDHWLVEVIYTRDLTMPLLQDPSSIDLPFLCLHHGNNSTDLFKEVKKVVDSHDRPWHVELSRSGWEDQYEGDVSRCAYCPTEFAVYKYYLGTDHDASETLIRSALEVAALRRATHQIMISRTIDLGSFYTPHSREWKALTTPYKGHHIERNPFRIAGPCWLNAARVTQHWKHPPTITERCSQGHGQEDGKLVKALDQGILSHHVQEYESGNTMYLDAAADF